MAKLVVGIGEAVSSNSSEDEIKTFALGSCVAVIFLDPKTRVGGMVHIALPDSNIDLEKSKSSPGHFADTGIHFLLALMLEKGATPNGKYITKIAGGANIMDKNDYFQIGKRNITAIKKILWDMNIPIASEDVGGTISRTVSIEMQTGRVYVQTADGSKRGL